MSGWVVCPAIVAVGLLGGFVWVADELEDVRNDIAAVRQKVARYGVKVDDLDRRTRRLERRFDAHTRRYHMHRYEDQIPAFSTCDGAGLHEVMSWVVAHDDAEVNGTLTVKVSGRTAAKEEFIAYAMVQFVKTNNALSVGAMIDIVPPRVHAALAGASIAIAADGPSMVLKFNGVAGKVVKLGGHVVGEGTVFDETE